MLKIVGQMFLFYFSRAFQNVSFRFVDYKIVWAIIL